MEKWQKEKVRTTNISIKLAKNRTKILDVDTIFAYISNKILCCLNFLCNFMDASFEIKAKPVL